MAVVYGKERCERQLCLVIACLMIAPTLYCSYLNNLSLLSYMIVTVVTIIIIT